MRQNTGSVASHAERHATRTRLITAGGDPYSPADRPTHTAAQLHRRYPELPAGTPTGESVVLAGRVMAHRAHGGMGFVDLRDGSGDVQLILADGVSRAPGFYARWRADVDLGDQVTVDGEVVTSRTGTLSVQVDGWSLTAKSLRPPPDSARARAGVIRTSDPAGERLPRYQRMMVDRREAARTRGRAEVLRALRDRLHATGHLEADTPLLHALPSGTARPFETWMHAWQTPLHLRGAVELFLKRLIIGGAERVFELGRVFRNEGTGAAFHPEFTVCEAYASHTDYLDSADLAESLVRAAAAALQRTEGPNDVTSAILLGAEPKQDTVSEGAARQAAQPLVPFTRIFLYELLSRHLGETLTPDTPAKTFARHARRLALPVPVGATAPALALLLFRKAVRPTLIRPTFVFDFPTRSARFARRSRFHPELVEAWSLVLAGTDVGQGCTELTDPVEQRRRMIEQQGEPGLEHLVLDEDFFAALEHGLPPLGGFSLGVDRLIGALRADGRRLSDQQCLPVERPATTRSSLPVERPATTRSSGLTPIQE